MRILIVEDEPRMLELLRMGLYEHGHTVLAAADGETGLEIATCYELDAIILDIGLPRLNGYELMQALRKQALKTPVLMLTARDKEDDIIRGLDLGADDYLTKPFSFPELVARLQAITRLVRNRSDDVMETGEVAVDANRQLVTRGQQSIDLTRQEFLLLSCLMRRAGQCVSRQSLMELIWGADSSVSASALDVLVSVLRTKLDGPFRTKLIGTVRGSGYVFMQTESAREGKAS
jgi:DNA-binding response OmpR family regulator